MFLQQFPRNFLRHHSFSKRCCQAFHILSWNSISTNQKSTKKLIKYKHFLVSDRGEFLANNIQAANTPGKYFSSVSNANEDFGQLLYVGKLQKQLLTLLGTFYALSIGVAVASPYILNLVSSSTIGLTLTGLHLFVFIILNPVGLYQFGKRYVNKLYYDKENGRYTAFLLSPFLFKDKRLDFSAEDCKMPANPTVFTSFYANNRPLFVNSDEMNYEEYMNMLRCASDLDFENPNRQEQYGESIKEAIKQKQAEQIREKEKL